MYIQDECLQRLSETNNLQKSLQQLKIISCGNVTDKGILALHKLTYVSPRGLPQLLLRLLWDCAGCKGWSCAASGLFQTCGVAGFASGIINE